MKPSLEAPSEAALVFGDDVTLDQSHRDAADPHGEGGVAPSRPVGLMLRNESWATRARTT
eukprot:scaffold2393_cov267-Pinguiococcus_pyrenoidosus.AAC.20